MEKSKEALAIKLNLEFDEVVSLFSEETLSSMEQEDLLGGSGWNIVCNGCYLFNRNCRTCTPAPTTPLHSPTPEPVNPGITTTPSWP